MDAFLNSEEGVHINIVELNMATLLMNLLGIIALVCAGIVVYGLRMKPIAHRSKVLKIGIVMVCLSCAALGGVHFLGDDANFNTPEEALNATYWKEKPEVIYKIQGETICTFIEQNKYDAVGDFSTVQLGGKWCELESKLNSHMGSCNDVAYKVISPKKSSETVILVNWSGLKMDTRLQIRDSYDSTFNEKRVDFHDGTSYYLYDTILPCVDIDYYIEIDGEKVKPFSE